MSGLNDDVYEVGRTLLSVIDDKLQDEIDPYALSSLAASWNTVANQVHNLHEPKKVESANTYNYISPSLDVTVMSEAVTDLEAALRKINNLKNVHLKSPE